MKAIKLWLFRWWLRKHRAEQTLPPMTIACWLASGGHTVQEGGEPVMLDKTKPVQTRDGRQVRNVCWDYRHEVSNNIKFIGGVVRNRDGKDCFIVWHQDGKRYYPTTFPQDDLINVPEKIEGWVNIYRTLDVDGEIRIGAVLHNNQVIASAQIPVMHQRRIACKFMSFTVGEGL